jgi:hypothetical protein
MVGQRAAMLAVLKAYKTAVQTVVHSAALMEHWTVVMLVVLRAV